MSPQEYQSSFDTLYTRLLSALNTHCYRTALARIRDIAHLEHTNNPSIPYSVIYQRLIRKYLPPNKISNIR